MPRLFRFASHIARCCAAALLGIAIFATMFALWLAMALCGLL